MAASAARAFSSGASTGTREAIELRDKDPKRYGGKGVRNAAKNVNETIAPALHGADAESQAAAGARLREMDRTENKAELGANAILGVSLVIARAVADSAGLPLYRCLAPNLGANVEAVEFILKAIERAGLKPGQDIMVALDPAASEFVEDGHYVFRKSDKSRRLVGDDVFVTSPKIIRKGVQEGVANAVLINLNQIGTVTETLDAIAEARAGGYGTMVSHRSGETSDDVIADVTVPQARANSRPAPLAAPSGWRSTTSSCASRRKRARRPATLVRSRSRSPAEVRAVESAHDCHFRGR